MVGVLFNYSLEVLFFVFFTNDFDKMINKEMSLYKSLEIIIVTNKQ